MKHLLIAFAAAGALVACNPKTAEIVEADTTSSTDGDMPKADIGEGKVVFIENCIGCHYGTTGPGNTNSLDNYSKEQIDAILPKMIKNAELNKDQSRQVAAYIYWELEN